MPEDLGWTAELFDEEYARAWGFPGADVTAVEVDRLVELLPPSSAKVLDLACGNGRHAVELARRGFDVVGRDASPAFIELAARAAEEAGIRVDLAVADMRELDIGGLDAVLILGNSFGYFDDAGNTDVLRTVADALRPGGMLAMDVLNRDRIVARYDPTPRTLTGRAGAVTIQSTFDPVTGANAVAHEWGGSDGTVVKRSSRQRLYTAAALSALLDATGLAPVGWFDGFSPAPFHLDASRILVTATRTST